MRDISRNILFFIYENTRAQIIIPINTWGGLKPRLPESLNNK
jgi:hypothetical protein